MKPKEHNCRNIENFPPLKNSPQNVYTFYIIRCKQSFVGDLAIVLVGKRPETRSYVEIKLFMLS